MARRASQGLRKRGGTWHIQKQLKGHGRLYESTGTGDLEEAERILARRLEAIRRVTVFGERPVVTFKDAAEKFLIENGHLRSLDRAALALDNVMPFIGDLPLQRVHNDSLAPFKESRRSAGISAGTINRELDVVRRVLILAARVWRHENGMPYLDTAPLLMRERGAQRSAHPLDWDEQERLLAELPPHLRDMMRFMLNTGLRDQELCQLRWDWEVDFPEHGTSVFIIPRERSKNGEERVVMLNRIAKEVVESQRGKHTERVFTYEGKPVGRMLNTSWKKARVRAGIPNLRVHDLRHTFGHRLRAAGVHAEDRKALLGHTNGDITTHYSAVDLSRLQEYVDRLVDQRVTVLRIGSRGARQSEAKMGQASGHSAPLGKPFLSA